MKNLKRGAAVTDTTANITVDQQGRITAAASGAASASAASLTRNCVVKKNSSNQVRVDADSVVLETAGGAQLLRRALANLIADITLSGAGGLDTGSATTGQWYYVWLIDNGSTTAAMLSLSATAPTMPGGYTYKTLVGAALYRAITFFDQFYGVDGRMFIIPNGVASLGATAAGTFQSLVLSLPAAAKFVSGFMGTSTVSVTETMAIASDSQGTACQVAGGASSTPALTIPIAGGGTQAIAGGIAFQDLPLITAQTVWWTANNTTANRFILFHNFRLW
jgi:hypothetical protein